jgi:hypothetical protein
MRRRCSQRRIKKFSRMSRRRGSQRRKKVILRNQRLKEHAEE